ncbi:MAG: hypothetical protein IPJ77_02155 [Planctomycetes bacterium]|nr:hypothetical protein [Planctomycetota bacterium]
MILEELLLKLLVRDEREAEALGPVRLARCTFCGKASTLRTERVRRRLRILGLWNVPIGDRVKVDGCSACRRAVLSLTPRRWERLCDAAHAAARAEPGAPRTSPEGWLDEHRVRLVFGDDTGAADLAYRLANDPRASARVHAELSLAQRWQGHAASSAESEARALELDRTGAATWALELERALERDDDERTARLLAARDARLEDLRQGTLRALLETLARHGRWRELHALLSTLLQRFPHLAFHADVRRAARQLRGKVDGARAIVLPRLPGEHKVRDRTVAAVATVLVVFAGLELWARLHRPVWVVNTHAGPLGYAFDGRARETFANRGVRRLAFALGAHAVDVDGPRATRLWFRLEAPRGLALLDRRAVVLDLAGDALLRVEPRSHDAEARPGPLLYGQDVYAFDGLERAFGEELGMAEFDVVLGERTGRLALVATPPMRLAMLDASAGRVGAALDLLEDRLQRVPLDRSLLLPFAWTAAQAGQASRARRLLEPLLGAEPWIVEAHDAARYVATEDELAPRLRAAYERWPENAPSTSTAFVLRAHLAERRDDALEWVARARAADPKNLRALRHAADLLAGVDWRAALACAQEGLALDAHDAFLLDLRSGARLALGEAAELERELRAELAAHPRHQERQGRLAELLVATGRSTELDLYIGEQERVKGFGEQGAQRLRVLAMEAGGRLEELAASEFDLRDEERTRWQMLALCELGRGAEFERRVGRERRIVDRWYDALVVALCFDLVRDDLRTRLWRERALGRLAPHSSQAAVARLLSSGAVLSPRSITELALGAHETSVLLTVAAARATGAERAELLAAAAQLPSVARPRAALDPATFDGRLTAPRASAGFAIDRQTSFGRARAACARTVGIGASGPGRGSRVRRFAGILCACTRPRAPRRPPSPASPSPSSSRAPASPLSARAGASARGRTSSAPCAAGRCVSSARSRATKRGSARSSCSTRSCSTSSAPCRPRRSRSCAACRSGSRRRTPSRRACATTRRRSG